MATNHVGKIVSGGGAAAYPLHCAVALEEHAGTVRSLESALDQLLNVNPRAGQVVELRCGGGLSFTEISAALGVAVSEVEMEWDFARRWLTGALAQ